MSVLQSIKRALASGTNSYTPSGTGAVVRDEYGFAYMDNSSVGSDAPGAVGAVERAVEAPEGVSAVPTHIENVEMRERTQRQAHGDQTALRLARPEGGRGPHRATIERVVDHQLDQARRAQQFKSSPLYRFLTVLAAEMNEPIDRLIGPIGTQVRVGHSHRESAVDDDRDAALAAVRLQQKSLERRVNASILAPLAAAAGDGGQDNADVARVLPDVGDAGGGGGGVVESNTQRLAELDAMRWLSRMYVLGIGEIADWVSGFIMIAIERLRASNWRIAGAPDEAFWESDEMYVPFAAYVALLRSQSATTSNRGTRFVHQSSIIQTHLGPSYYYLVTFMRYNAATRRIEDARRDSSRASNAAAGATNWATPVARPIMLARASPYTTDSAGFLLPLMQRPLRRS